MSTWLLSGPVRLDADTVVDRAWVVGDRITFTAPAGPVDGTVEGWAMPGLVDAHCHVGLTAEGPADRATARAQALADRDAGALLLRDAGSPSDTRWVDGEDDLPRIVRAGRHVARTRRYLRGIAVEVEPPDLAAQVVAQARAGDGWVKIVGDWIDRDLGDLAPCWPDADLRRAVEVAHAAGARVTAHCFGPDALPGLLAAGVDGVEHGTGFTADTVAAAAAAGVAVVPTLVQVATFPGLARQGEAKFPVWAARMRDLHARADDTVRALHDAGVPLFAGTDAGTVHPHGLVADEVRRLAAVLGDPVAALGGASWDARAWLRRDGLTEGAPADLVVHPADPLADLGVLAAPAAVVLRGRPHRLPPA